MMLSKLGQLDSAEAAKDLTSIMKGYNKTVEESIGIVDELTAVDMKAAVTAGDIATAMSETNVSARLAGVSMEKLVGYITTVMETTQDSPESVGNFFKTMFSRMGNVKQGRLTDPETEEDLSNVETALRAQGIELRKNKTEFRDFGDVLDEVSSKWNGWNDVQRAAIATAFGLARQQEKFKVLMDKYTQSMGYAEIATDSAGTAQEKYKNYTEGTEAAVKSFTAQFEAFTQSILNAKTVSDVTNFGSGFLGFLTEANDKVGLLNIALPVLFGLLSKNIGLFRAVGDGEGIGGSNVSTLFGVGKSKKLDISPEFVGVSQEVVKTTKVAEDTMSEFVGAQVNVAKTTNATKEMMAEFVGAEGKATAATATLATAEGAAAKSTSVLGAAFKAALLNMAIIAAIEIVIAVLDKLIVTVEEQKQKVEEANAAYNKTKTELETVNSELATMSSRIDELSSKKMPTLAEKEELITLRQENEELRIRKNILTDTAKQQAIVANNEIKNLYKKQMQNGTSYENPYKQQIANDPNYSGTVKELFVSGENYVPLAIKRLGELRAYGESITQEQLDEQKIIKDNLLVIAGQYLNMADGVNVVDESSARTQAHFKSMMEYIDRALHPEQWASDNELTPQDIVKTLHPESWGGADEGIDDTSKATEKAIGFMNQLQAVISDTSEEGEKKLKKLKSAVDTSLDFRSTTRQVQDAIDVIYEMTGIKIDINADGATETLNMLNAYLDGSIDKVFEYMLAAAKASGATIDTSSPIAAIASLITWLNSGIAAAKTFAAVLVSIGAGFTNDPALSAPSNGGPRMDGKFRFNQSWLDSILNAKVPGGGGGGSGDEDVLQAYKSQKDIYMHQAEMSEKRQNLMQAETAEWESEQQKQYEIYVKIAELIQAEMIRLKKLGYATTSKEIMELEADAADIQAKIYEFQKQQFDKLQSARKKAIENQKKRLDEAHERRMDQLQAEIDRTSALIGLNEKQRELQKSIDTEKRVLAKEYDTARNAYPNLTPSERETLFSESDYNQLMSQLDQLETDSAIMWNEYQEQIKAVSVEEAYKLDYITSQYEQQYNLKMKQYEIAKQNLAVSRAEVALANAQKERSVAMLINGQWTWVADPEAVKSAMDAMYEAEQQKADAESDYIYTQKVAELEEYKASIQMQKDAAEAQHEKLMEQLDKQLERLEAQVFSMNTAIDNMNSFGDKTLDAFEALAKSIEAGTSAIDDATDNALSRIRSASASTSSGSSSGSSNYSSSKTVKSGDKGEDVTSVQTALEKLGYDVGKTGADGIYGSKTRAAVIQFQKDAKIKADGIVGSQTANKLIDKLRESGFATGGPIKHTGLAWVDGTEQDPELVVNSGGLDDIDYLLNGGGLNDFVKSAMSEAITREFGYYKSISVDKSQLQQITDNRVFIDGIQLTETQGSALVNTLANLGLLQRAK